MKYLECLPQLIRELIEADIPVIITKNGFVLEGWYRQGKVILFTYQDSTIEQGETVYTLSGSHGIISKHIYSLEDLVAEHFAQWQAQNYNRRDDWDQPEKAWIPLLVKSGFIKEEVKKRWVPVL